MIAIKEFKKYETDIIKNYENFHMYPETGFEEKRTTEIIATILENCGLEVIRINIEDTSKIMPIEMKKNIEENNITYTKKVTTGVIGILKGNNKGKTVVLRADIDALNVQEETDLKFKSKIEGKMHACGHDAHASMLLGAAQYLSSNKEKINGTIKFIFQPAEEGPAPGGGSVIVGSRLIDDADAAFALHVTPTKKAGEILIPETLAMASTDFFKITIVGKGTHGSAPHLGIDPIIISAQIINALQSIVNRQLDPIEPAVFSICQINGGTAPNAIPKKVEMTGTVRSYSEEIREAIFDKAEKLIKSITEGYGANYKFNRMRGYPSTINNENMSKLAFEICSKLLGDKNVEKTKKPNMAGEDFSFYLKNIPGVFMWLGCGNNKDNNPPMLHSSNFLINKDCLTVGSAVYSNLAIEFLNKKKER